MHPLCLHTEQVSAQQIAGTKVNAFDLTPQHACHTLAMQQRQQLRHRSGEDSVLRMRLLVSTINAGLSVHAVGRSFRSADLYKLGMHYKPA